MTPTPKLRWALRKYKLGTFYRDGSGNEAEGEHSVLQQWWAIERDGQITPTGEWRDVPLEKEE